MKFISCLNIKTSKRVLDTLWFPVQFENEHVQVFHETEVLQRESNLRKEFQFNKKLGVVPGLYDQATYPEIRERLCHCPACPDNPELAEKTGFPDHVGE